MEENKTTEIPVLAQNPNKPPAPPSSTILKDSDSAKPKGSKMSKLPWLIILILLFLIGILSGYLAINFNKQNQKQTTTTPTPTTSEQQTENSPTPKITSVEAKSFTSEKLKDLSFKGYSLSYPADWSLSEKREESVSISTVTLTKDGYTLKIYQAPTGGAACIYEGDLPEGPASDYRNDEYTEIITGFGTLRQTESPSNGKMAYAYCQKNQNENSYGQPTSVGHMSVSTQVANPDPEIISEIEKIVESIKAE